MTATHSQRPGDGDRDERKTDLGVRLRGARQAKHVGLRELARRIGVSPSLISQIETGKSAPSVGTLTAIVNELGLPVNEVFDPTSYPGAAAEDDRRQPARAGAVEAPPTPIQRNNDRRKIQLDSGVTWERLTAQHDGEVDFLLVRYQPGGSSTQSESLMRHNGREYGYVLSGRLQVSIGFDTFQLGPGDSIAFDSTDPHRLATIGDEPVEAIWFVVGRRPPGAADGRYGLPS